MKRTVVWIVGMIILYLVLLTPASLAIAMAFLFFLGAKELAAIMRKGWGIFIDFAVLGPIPFFILPLIWGLWGTAAALLLLAVISLVRSFVFKGSNGERKKRVFKACFFAGIYLGLLPSHLIYLRMMENGRNLALLVFLTVVAVDTAAYIVGKMARKIGCFHGLTVISPGKTWEGAIGGFLAGVLVPFIVSKLGLATGISADWWLMIGGLTAIFGQLGDIFESHLKRMANLKDSGSIIPGHGGILDRFDSHIAASPVAFYSVLLLALLKL